MNYEFVICSLNNPLKYTDPSGYLQSYYDPSSGSFVQSGNGNNADGWSNWNNWYMTVSENQVASVFGSEHKLIASGPVGDFLGQGWSFTDYGKELIKEMYGVDPVMHNGKWGYYAEHSYIPKSVPMYGGSTTQTGKMFVPFMNNSSSVWRGSLGETDPLFIWDENSQGRTAYETDGKGNYVYYYPDGTVEYSQNSPRIVMLQDLSMVMLPHSMASVSAGTRTVGATKIVGNTTSRLSTSGVKLIRNIASRSQMSEAGTTIISGNLKTGPRLAQQYGGNVSDWVKMSSSSFSKYGKTIQTHWYQNISSGQRVEFKTKLIKGW